MKKRIYICGPMRKIPLYNFPAFHEAEEILARFGWDVLNPAKIDNQHDGFDPNILPDTHDWNGVPETMDLKAIVKRDVEALLECDAIYMLPGWKNSKGAVAEVAVADWLGLEKRYSTFYRL